MKKVVVIFIFVLLISCVIVLADEDENIAAGVMNSVGNWFEGVSGAISGGAIGGLAVEEEPEEIIIEDQEENIEEETVNEKPEEEITEIIKENEVIPEEPEEDVVPETPFQRTTGNIVKETKEDEENINTRFLVRIRNAIASVFKKGDQKEPLPAFAPGDDCPNRVQITPETECTCDTEIVSSGYCCYYDPPTTITHQTSTKCGYTKWSPHLEHIETFVVHYSRASGVPEETPEVLGWVGQNFDYVLGGVDLRNYNPEMLWPVYLDLIGPGIPLFLDVKDVALDKNYDFEVGVVHSLVDFFHTGYAPISHPDAFGIWEGEPHYHIYNNYGINGVIAFDGNSYSDFSVNAYSTDTNDVSFCQGSGDYLYLGFEEPFDEINFIPGDDVGLFTYQWEYYDGNTWQILTPNLDTTNFLTASGQIQFTPLQDWDVIAIDNSREKFFIRINCLGVTNAPTASRFFGYDYYAGNPGEFVEQNARKNIAVKGWDVNDPNVITVTTRNIKYNPSPPSGASARFEYWSRVIFSIGYAMNLDLDTQSDKFLVWADGAVSGSYYRMIGNDNSPGMMFDDAQRTCADYSALNLAQTDFGGDGVEYNEAMVYRNQYIYDGLKAINPDYVLGQNNYRIEFLPLMDYQLRENIIGNTLNLDVPYIWNEHSFEGYNRLSKGGYDNYEQESVIGLMFYSEQASTAERGPMNALSSHYIGANDYTIFGYHSHGDGDYGYEGKGVICNDGTFSYEFDGCDTHGGIRQYNSWFPAIEFDIGQPLDDRYEWQSSPTIYRRDFENAIVVVRGGNAAEDYSNPFSLGENVFRLRANGDLDSATDTISLRSGEGTILIRESSTQLDTCEDLFGVDCPPPTYECDIDYVPASDTDYCCTGACSLAPVSPTISDFQCYFNGAWQNCDLISYGETIEEAHATCTQGDALISEASFVLHNEPDGTDLIDQTISGQGPQFTIQPGLQILDSGQFTFTATCTDEDQYTDSEQFVWSFDWGTLNVEVVSVV